MPSTAPDLQKDDRFQRMVAGAASQAREDRQEAEAIRKRPPRRRRSLLFPAVFVVGGLIVAGEIWYISQPIEAEQMAPRPTTPLPATGEQIEAINAVAEVIAVEAAVDFFRQRNGRLPEVLAEVADELPEPLRLKVLAGTIYMVPDPVKGYVIHNEAGDGLAFTFNPQGGAYRPEARP